MTDGSWNRPMLSAGVLIGGAITAVIVLVTRDLTRLQLAIAITSALAAAVIALAIIRHSTTTWSTMWFSIGAIIAPSVVYPMFRWFGPKPSLPRASVELPGFSVELVGEETGGFTAEYDFGWLRHHEKYSELTVTVLWKAGDLANHASRDDEAAAWIGGFEYEERVTVSARETPLTWTDLETRSYRVFFDMVRGDLTFIACGARLVAVITEGGVRRDAERTHRHQVATFRCAPIAEEEALIGKAPPIQVSPPEGWGPVTDVVPEVAHWSNGEASMMFIYFYRGHEILADMPAMVNAGIDEWGAVTLTGHEQVGAIDLWQGTQTFEGGEEQVLAYQMLCRSRPVLAVLFGKPSLDEARPAFLAARCE